MKKKSVLGIMGSPRRRGNTEVLVSEILRGAREMDAHVETVFLSDLDIRECDGCHLCWEGRTCPKDDDMLPLFSRITESDVLVFGTPVYWYGPSALMKLFIDRFVYFNCPENRKSVRGKKALLVAPFEDQAEDTASLLVHFFERSFSYLEMEFAGTLLVPGVTKRGEVKNNREHMEKARILGRRLAEIA